ncbi:hypothetical protein [Flammeovirga kamogawensis]|uniref:Uncharacterized protein n=1 Tax=Flammeovirga kamogawensis TaxID=373891 RepID=A0ABX8GZ97_9BACT|nr:hypothetical protein [Flammeovirga kamogawensis]MBB6458941.1 hypothetical protein [Flammeovirga kamogawensis]QWG08517.1 hypothetical protein KM029_06155 [Flammeovirga kamogawensis]TRX66810.1 hypothetical protein EO216_01205 [Flammeovirga kamogawensis]
MENTPELNSQGKYLGTITKDFIKVYSVLQEASYQIRKRNFSNYPIFPVSKTQLSIGQHLVGPDQKEFLTWNYGVSYAEEFLQKELILADKFEEFKKSYKNANEFCCLFVIDDEFVNFVYIPYPLDEEGNEVL